MVEEKITRKLTTILAADIEGSSRLMRADEEATLNTLAEYREIFDDLIARHDGRVFSAGGDGAPVEFGSAVDAVRCAARFHARKKFRAATPRWRTTENRCSVSASVSAT